MFVMKYDREREFDAVPKIATSALETNIHDTLPSVESVLKVEVSVDLEYGARVVDIFFSLVWGCVIFFRVLLLSHVTWVQIELN